MPVGIGTPIGMYIAARINKNHYDESSAVLLALTEVTNEIFTQSFKYSFQRNRPYRTLNNVKFTDTSSVRGTFSFPSGHASGSFAIATSLTLRYPDKPVLIAGLYAYALTVSLGRIYWGVHYPSDIITGMIVGAGSAALIYSLRKPIIKAKNNFFNQSGRTESSNGEVNTTAILLSVIASDMLNSYFINSKSKVLKQSKINLTHSSSTNYINYTYNF
ncbi:MAG: phosphatase PAP2 family protein [Ignavibacteria bacterium]